ncbi:hypothetical protein Ancab_038342, partial [Ancistrocladus abbreviatus]
GSRQQGDDFSKVGIRRPSVAMRGGRSYKDVVVCSSKETEANERMQDPHGTCGPHSSKVDIHVQSREED